MIAQTVANLITFIVNQQKIFKIAKSFYVQGTVLLWFLQQTSCSYEIIMRFELRSEVISSLMTLFATHSIPAANPVNVAELFNVFTSLLSNILFLQTK